MSRTTRYLLACTTVLTTVMGLRPGPPRYGIGYQCMDRGGFHGACISQNEFDGELTCLSLACAWPEADGSYRAVYTGPVKDGTLCGYNKVCEESVCVRKYPGYIVYPIGTEPRLNCNSPPVVDIPPYPPGSSPERNRPQLVVPLPHLPWLTSSSEDSSSSEDGASSSSGRSSPAGSERWSSMASCITLMYNIMRFM